jgi:predicted DNA-binding protein with PD1-like motif
VKTKRIDAVDHRLVLLEKGDRWPDALLEAIEKAGLSSGTFRGSAVLRDVEVRTFDSTAGQREGARHLEGPLEAVVIDGAFGLTRGSIAVTARTVLALRDSFGERITSGSVESARLDGGEVLVSGFPGTDLVRTMRGVAGVWLFQLEAESIASPAQARERVRDDEAAKAPKRSSTMPAVAGAWASLADASDAMVSEPVREVRAAVTRAVQPPRAPHIVSDADDGNPSVEQGAVVEHFAFGEGDVLKSDGERIHARFERDGRIREVSLNVTKVTAAGTRRGKPYFKIAKRG